LLAGVAGLLAGAAVFLAFASAGLLLTQRLAGGTDLVLVAIAILFAAAGAYAGWVVGLIVFSALRGVGEEASESG
jgi:hypothetical protein